MRTYRDNHAGGRRGFRARLVENRSMERRMHLQKGLSLPEVLVSSLIALIGIGALLSTFLTGRFVNTAAQHYNQAMSLARARAEYLKSLLYRDLSALPSPTTEAGLPLDPRDNGNFIPCDRLTTLQPEDNGMTIEVVVSWNERAAGSGSRSCSFALKTWVVSPRKPSAT